MFAQQTYRPEIARVAEETVLNLKQLEVRIEALKNDLASLCTVLGIPEVARIAVTPPSWLGITQPHVSSGFPGATLGVQGMGQVPWGTHVGTPFGSPHSVAPGSPYGSQGFSPYTQGSSPFQGQGIPQAQGFNPYTQGINPYASQGINPQTQGFNPYTQGISPYASQGTPFPPQFGAWNPLTPGVGFR